MILVPVKDFANSKQRLAAVLTPVQRAQLARAMFTDVLHALAAVPSAPSVAIVTRDVEAMRLADVYGFTKIYDGLNAGETEAITAATEQAIQRGAEFTMVIPGDAPLVTPEEISRLLAALPEKRGAVLAAAGDGQGTNAVLRRPAGLFALRFGNHSYMPHLKAAIATHSPIVVLKLYALGLGLDVDRPPDLDALAHATGNTESQRLVRSWGFGNAAIAQAAGF